MVVLVSFLDFLSFFFAIVFSFGLRLSSLTQGGWPRPAEPPRFKVLSYRTAFFRVVVLLSFLPFLSFFAISRFLQGSELTSNVGEQIACQHPAIEAEKLTRPF